MSQACCKTIACSPAHHMDIAVCTNRAGKLVIGTPAWSNWHTCLDVHEYRCPVRHVRLHANESEDYLKQSDRIRIAVSAFSAD